MNNKILIKLEEWEQKDGQLPGSIKLYRELLQIQSRVKSGISIVKPDLVEDLVRDRLHRGIPLLSFKSFSPDWHEVQSVFEQVAVWAAKDAEDSSEEGETLRKIGRNHALLKKVAEVWYRGHSLTDIAAAEGIDDQLLTSVIAAALKPFLLAYSRLLMPKVDQKSWLRNYCPICGGNPDFAYLDREEGARWLVCSHCEAEWLFLRLECPYCGTQNQNALAYFTDDGESHLYRLYVCEQCLTYIKTIDLRHTEVEILLSLEQVLTRDLDKLGQEKGYNPGWARLAI